MAIEMFFPYTFTICPRICLDHSDYQIETIVSNKIVGCTLECLQIFKPPSFNFTCNTFDFENNFYFV